MTLTCPNCHTLLAGGEAAAGRPRSCPRCGHLIKPPGDLLPTPKAVSPWLLVGTAAAVVLALAGGLVGLVWLLKPKPMVPVVQLAAPPSSTPAPQAKQSPDATVARPGQPVAAVRAARETDQPPGNRPGPPAAAPDHPPVSGSVASEGAVNETPGPGLGGRLAPAVLERVKRCTAYLRVHAATGADFEGSGFLAVEPGLVLTNAHVLDMLEPGSRPPRRLDVVLDSGQKTERRLAGKVLGVDRASDLAVLRVVAPHLPGPLRVRSARALQETEPVYVFGFPYGERLGKNVTISVSSVSSLRSEGGVLSRVQVNGGMHPGNSGGPVVDSAGRVVGVAVAGIANTEIHFAVPGDYVHAALNGRLDDMTLGQPYRDPQGCCVPVVVHMLDPLGRIRAVGFDVWTADPGDASGRRSAQAVMPIPLAYRPETARGDIRLPELPPGQVYWLQPTWVGADGARQQAPPRMYTLLAPPVEQKPALLVLRHRVGEDQLSLTRQSTLLLYTDRGDALSFTTNWHTQATETVQAVDADGTARVRLHYSSFSAPSTFNGAGQPPGPRLEQIQQAVTSLAADLRLDRQGKIRASPVDTRRLPAKARDGLTRVHEQARQLLEILAVPLPGKQVAAGESWTASGNLPIDVPGESKQTAVDLTYTYLGRRTRGTREEAVLGLEGVVRGREEKERWVAGRVSGSAVLDLTAGQIYRVEATVTLDLLVPLLGEPVKARDTLEVRLRRTLPAMKMTR